MSLTSKEESIYNAFLIAGRTVKNKPFQLRKNFSNIDNTTYVCLKKLSELFKQNQHITPSDYFVAPYHVYGTDQYFDLSFFLTRKAIKCYTIFKKQENEKNPDDIEMIDRCKSCCSFIYKFCKENNLTLLEYQTQDKDATPLVLQHLKDHKINFYIIHGLNCASTITRVERELVEFILPDFYQTLNETRINFQKSTNLKKIVRKSLSIIEELLLKNKQKNIK